MISLSLGNMDHVQFLHRVEDVYPTFGQDHNGLEILGYDVETITEEVTCDSERIGGGWAMDDVWFGGSLENSFDANSSSGGSTGLGGSLARFSIAGDHLYAVDESSLKVFHIGEGENLEKINDAVIGWGIETLFGYDEKLFVGGMTGMSIYDLVDPTQPEYLGGYDHIWSCDPVFVKEDYAYVTLRSGTPCDGFTNQLDLVNISDPRNVRLEKTFQMKNPHGLSIDRDNLFLSEGDHGLKVYDISNPHQLDQNLRQFLTQIETRDIISLPGESDIILVVGPRGIYQFDYSDPSQLRELSFITLPGF
ncbi:MAG: hypothetical protein HKN16_12450 [Saprospiraceae bacterium]|nr:hypothetical protein [Saprospiraceae bacterium]